MSCAHLVGPLPQGLLQHCGDHIRTLDLSMRVADGGIAIVLPNAEIRLILEGVGLRLRIKAESALCLYQARETVTYLLDQIRPGMTEDLTWTGTVDRHVAPPNFHLATVESVRRVAPRFLRVELACATTAALTSGGMHFSLLLPPTAQAAQWPQIDGNGRTVWPHGPNALHRAAYTFVHLDPDAGRFSFDLFEHDGGRVTEWARRNPVGQTVGLTGPGGGDLPAGQHLLIAGDETALPAIRRILSLSPRDRIGTALIEVAREEDRLDLEAPTGMQVHWLIRNRGAHWIDSLVNRPVPADGSSRFVWCAAELSQVRTAKAYFRDTLGLPRSEGYFSGFWSRSVAPQG